MKIDFNQHICDVWGQYIPEADGVTPATLKSLVLSNLQLRRDGDFAQVSTAIPLAFKIVASNGQPVELSIEEIAFIQSQLKEPGLPAIVRYRAVEMLEGGT